MLFGQFLEFEAQNTSQRSSKLCSTKVFPGQLHQTTGSWSESRFCGPLRAQKLKMSDFLHLPTGFSPSILGVMRCGLDNRPGTIRCSMYPGYSPIGLLLGPKTTIMAQNHVFLSKGLHNGPWRGVRFSKMRTPALNPARVCPWDSPGTIPTFIGQKLTSGRHLPSASVLHTFSVSVSKIGPLETPSRVNLETVASFLPAVA